MLYSTLLKDILENKTFLLTVISLSTLIKSVTLILLARQTNSTATRPRALLMCMLICSIMIDSSWIVNLLNELFLPNLDYRIRLFSVRMSWGFDALLYLAISLFTGVLVQQKKQYSLHQILLAIWYIAFFLSFMGFAFIDINCLDACERPYLERLIQGIFIISTAILLPAVIIFNIWKMHHISLPRILKNQVKIFVYGIMTTFWFSELLQVLPLNFAPYWVTNSYATVSISTLIITFVIIPRVPSEPTMKSRRL